MLVWNQAFECVDSNGLQEGEESEEVTYQEQVAHKDGLLVCGSGSRLVSMQICILSHCRTQVSCLNIPQVTPRNQSYSSEHQDFILCSFGILAIKSLHLAALSQALRNDELLPSLYTQVPKLLLSNRRNEACLVSLSVDLSDRGLRTLIQVTPHSMFQQGSSCIILQNKENHKSWQTQDTLVGIAERWLQQDGGRFSMGLR